MDAGISNISAPHTRDITDSWGGKDEVEVNECRYLEHECAAYQRHCLRADSCSHGHRDRDTNTNTTQHRRRGEDGGRF